MNCDDCQYRPKLPMPELIVAIRRLLEAERHVDRLLCRYLADLADRIESRAGYDLGGFSDVYHAARCLFDMSVRRKARSTSSTVLAGGWPTLVGQTA